MEPRITDQIIKELIAGVLAENELAALADSEARHNAFLTSDKFVGCLTKP
jgi:hypothetical protein